MVHYHDRSLSSQVIDIDTEEKSHQSWCAVIAILNAINKEHVEYKIGNERKRKRERDDKTKSRQWKRMGG